MVAVIWLSWSSYRGYAEERAGRERDREQLFLPTLEALVAAIEAGDEHTHGHNRRVRGYALGFAHVASGPMVRSSYHADRQAAGAGVAA